MTPDPIVDVAADAEALAERVAVWLTTKASLAPSRWSLCLSGGSTPKRVYELLAGEELRRRVDWRKVHLFWGDERFVPHDSPDSNFKMAFEAMIARVPIPPGQVHAVPTDAASPERAAELYAETLRSFYGGATIDPARPLFDVTLLGLGADGHTASLFPGSAALDQESDWTAAVLEQRPPRVTLTFPALEASRDIVFIVAGAGKKEALAQVLGGDRALPAARVATRGGIRIFADRAAAGAA